ncbi:MAG TPA: hypothetical protein VE978_23440 [Chitinophagales bacterium]|nr:hypothetical protein [Chitinophagales bacterium]
MTYPPRIVVFLPLLLSIFCSTYSSAQKAMRLKWTSSGVFTVGIRTGLVFSSDNSGWNIGQGMGLQARIMATSHINTEWYFEYFHGGYTSQGVRTDGHIGGLVLLYPQHRLQRVAPFLAVGPNADYLKLRERINKKNFVSRWSLAANSGIGMHINLTRRSDMTITTMYMLHFGQELILPLEDASVITIPRSGSGTDGHFIVNISFNYKIADLWKRLKF